MTKKTHSKREKYKPLKLWSLLAALAGLTSFNAVAHPVSYQGALSFMTWNQSFLSDYWTTYSFARNWALAARYVRMDMPEGDFRFYGPQLDYLLQRWNETDSQANIYIYGSFGGVRLQNQNGSAFAGGIEADIETRKYFLMGKLEALLPSLGPNSYQASVRVGIAPYRAEFEELASWFMVQAQYHPSLIRNYAITPMVRFFYKNVLLETGVSLNGDGMLNLMFHF